MEEEYIKEPANKLLLHGPKVIKYIRNKYNIDRKEDRDRAIAIVHEWIQTQDHIILKNYGKGYIERSIATCNGSIERTKKQIDRISTMKTLMPKYFDTTNIKESDIMTITEKGNFGLVPKQTKEYYRIIILKAKPDAVVNASDYTLLYKFLIIMTEYIKANDFAEGYIIVGDLFDANITDVLPGINLLELQQFLPILTKGYGCHIKGIYLITASKFIEGFIKLLKPLFSEKIASRIHAITTRNSLQNLINGDILPKEYGGNEKSVEELHDDLFEALSEPSMQEYLKIMNKAGTDESKRQVYEFNDKYMGISGTFRTLSLD